MDREGIVIAFARCTAKRYREVQKNLPAGRENPAAERDTARLPAPDTPQDEARPVVRIPSACVARAVAADVVPGRLDFAEAGRDQQARARIEAGAAGGIVVGTRVASVVAIRVVVAICRPGRRRRPAARHAAM